VKKRRSEKEGKSAKDNLTSAALPLLYAASDFEQPIEHFRAFRAPQRELSIGLFVHVLQAMQFIGYMKGRENGHFQGINRQRS